jgi:DNA-directed RNA polymerase specialized sigma24 family protein
MAAFRLHLVDAEGQPLPEHIVKAVETVESHIYSRFMGVCDPAELATSMEEGARGIARREQRHGRLQDVTSYTFRALTNRALSLCGLRAHETSLSGRSWSYLTDVPGPDHIQSIARGREIEQKLAHLSERDRSICELALQNYKAKEIAEELAITAATVRKVLSRIRASIASK